MILKHPTIYFLDLWGSCVPVSSSERGGVSPEQSITEIQKHNSHQNIQENTSPCRDLILRPCCCETTALFTAPPNSKSFNIIFYRKVWSTHSLQVFVSILSVQLSSQSIQPLTPSDRKKHHVTEFEASQVL